jgi:two-component system sensor histidine kinase TctE
VPKSRPIERQHRQTSLFGEIVDWVFAPFLILWPVSMAIEYSVAYSVASAAYDRELGDSVVALSRQVSWERGKLKVSMPAAAQSMLQARGTKVGHYQVRGLRNEVVDGDRTLPAIEFQPELEPRTVYFRNDFADGQDVRVAYMFAQVRGLTGAVLVQVAEGEDKRIQLASDISGAVLGAQFVILPLALLMVFLGLSKGIAPLDELRDKIRGREPEDLSPIDANEAPEEVRPFIHSINDLMSRLESSLRAQQRFVADAAHQMRTPLAGLKTQAEVALRQRDAANVEHAMRQIAAGADRASRLVNQLLALARADRDTPPAMEPLDLDWLACDTAREWVAKAMDRRIDLGYEGTQGPCMIHGNASLLRELLNNLIDNAIRYTEPGGQVTVRLAAGDAVTVEVEDNGSGIAPADRELVFERFYRVLGTGADGSGLGLSIVREIAGLHRASVRIDANPRGRGTLVRMSLQRAMVGPKLRRIV